MANSILLVTPRFSEGDILIFDKKVYKVTTIYPGLIGIESPFFYGVILESAPNKRDYYGKELFLWEGHLKHISDIEIAVWKTLYGG